MVSKKLIICEGNDDIGLLNRYMVEYLGYQKNLFDIIQMNGKSNLLNSEYTTYLTITPQVETGQYDRVLFVFDADFEINDTTSGGYKNSELKVQELIQQLDFISIADYFICCDPETKNGNFEHLLLSVAEENRRACIEQFIDCIQGVNTAGNKKIVYTAYNTIFKEHPYKFDHPNFDGLKQKVERLFT